ncbi:MAG: right-handed parallel beta-helix repeat-containing protein [Parasphingopyxis sp.]|nr:right-handed parallel beta-helix repeat-containing protein [Sphingomonadales bacterium]
MRIFLVAMLAALAVAPPIAAQRQAPFTIAETGEGFARLQDAVDAIGGGQGTIAIAAGRYRQCAVQDHGGIHYRANSPGSAVFSGAACEGKAALVLRGRSARVEGLVFEGIAVADRNGAGIRIEEGDLEVLDSVFRDSQQGILSASDPDATIRIDRSTFSGLGRCDEDYSCAHSIYVGGYGALEVTRSRFERGRGGHYVKSRAARVRIADSSFDDSRGSATNYMIDLPAGATGLIAGNVFVQGRDKENYSAFIAVGAEDIRNASAGLEIGGNSAGFVPGLSRASVFVADWTGEPLRLAQNSLAPGLTPFERR